MFFLICNTFKWREKHLIPSCGGITKRSCRSGAEMSFYRSRKFKLCAGSARSYAVVRHRSPPVRLSTSSLKCLLCPPPICRDEGTAVVCKIGVVYVLLLCSSAPGLYPVCASNRRHHQSGGGEGGPSNSGRPAVWPAHFGVSAF